MQPTIAAIATPPGQGGIGIVRISGALAKEILSRLFLPLSPDFENFQPWRLYRGRVLDRHDEAVDDALAVFMPGPRTFTGEDVAEIHCHGSPLILAAVMESAINLGARAAARGDFSRRAFLNGRLDLSQAEAVAELIASPSREALRQSLLRLDGLLGQKVAQCHEVLEDLRSQAIVGLDFPDDEVPALSRADFAKAVQTVLASLSSLLHGARRGRLMREGALVVLAGAVNVGKSSLLNALLGRKRALVSEYAGTTRDFIEESCDLEGLPVRLVDTAGLRSLSQTGASSPDGRIEDLGMSLSRQRLAEADAVLVVVDGGALGEKACLEQECPDLATREILALLERPEGGIPALLVWNKRDLCSPANFPPPWADGILAVQVCATSGENLDSLTRSLRELLLAGEPPAEGALAPNARQTKALEKAIAELEALLADIGDGQSYDCCVARLDCASAELDSLLGLGSAKDLLDRVFARFCIGK